MAEVRLRGNATCDVVLKFNDECPWCRGDVAFSHPTVVVMREVDCPGSEHGDPARLILFHKDCLDAARALA